MPKRYNSVMDMVRDRIQDKTYHDQLEKEINDRSGSKFLRRARASLGMSRKAVADNIGCPESYIEDIESRRNSRLNMEDTARYIQGLGRSFVVSSAVPNLSTTDRIKALTLETIQLLDKLPDLIQDDQVIQEGVENFYEEYIKNVMFLFLRVQQRVRGRELTMEELSKITIDVYDTMMNLTEDREEDVPQPPSFHEQSISEQVPAV